MSDFAVKLKIKHKDSNRRLGALDLIARAKEQKRLDKKHIIKLVSQVKDPSSSEEVIISAILEKKEAQIKTDIKYNENYRKDFKLEFSATEHRSSLCPSTQKAEGKRNLDVISIDNSMTIDRIFRKSTEELLEITKKLSALIDKHADYEYTDRYGREHLIGEWIYGLSNDDDKNSYDRKPKVSNLPLSEVWLKFYEDEIKDFATLFQFVTLYDVPSSGYSFKEEEQFVELSTKIMGFDIYDFASKIDEDDIKYGKNQVPSIMGSLYREFKEENRDYVFGAGKSIISLLYQYLDPKNMIVNTENYYGVEEYHNIMDDAYIFSDAKKNLNYYNDKVAFTQAFFLKYAIRNKFHDYARANDIELKTDLFSTHEIVKAVELKLVDSDLFYKYAFENSKDYVASISYRLYGPVYAYEIKPKLTYSNDENTAKFVMEHGKKVIDYIIDSELKRGDSPLKHSDAVPKIRKVEGIDRLIAILLALGKDTLDRNSFYFYGNSYSKKSNLSHLLRVSEPLETDSADLLREKLKGKNIPEKRLIDLAMYAPKWIPILEEYLGWKGLASGCYYFQAHTSDINRKMEGLFGKYTPISIEDLEAGAFDIDWFKSAYGELGEEHFELLYDSAKYISDGAKHSRARMFADAVLGKLDITEVEDKISEKRNQNMVMSYSLIPLEKDASADILKRYKFLQNFLKESRQFGAQRRASEAKAVSISLENLSRNAGYTDVTRLTCAVETQLISELGEYFKPVKVGDISAYVEIDEDGKSDLVYEKDGKRLKSLPSKYGKDAHILQLKEVNKNLRNQYSRFKNMLEISMEDAVEFYPSEIGRLMSNPVFSPLLKPLVFVSEKGHGFFADGVLLTADGEKIKLGKNSMLRIAHSLDLYESGKWEDYQKYLFDNEIKQPFKQVFRELYVKTRDELGKDNSLRYAGHQVQPAKTVSMLKNRRWILDGEEGLQKVYYKKNIIAKIYALANWFSPAEIEAPTLEWVCFYERKNFKPIKIDDVPDLIFTEVMRDVDLAVSVAHVGGVDPETSHSTIEMRKAILELNLKLFKLSNVKFSENFALIKGDLAEYSVHLGSGVIHQKAGAVINVLPVHSQHRGRIFLPFVDEDPKTAEIMSKIILFAQDKSIKDPFILEQITC